MFILVMLPMPVILYKIVYQGALPRPSKPILQLPVLPQCLVAPRLARQARQPLDVLARLAVAGLRAGRRQVGHALGVARRGPQRVEQAHRRLGRQVLEVVVVDLHHGRVDARAQALDLGQREQPVGRRLARVDAELRFQCLHDDVGAHAAELTGSLERDRGVSAVPAREGPARRLVVAPCVERWAVVDVPSCRLE